MNHWGFSRVRKSYPVLFVGFFPMIKSSVRIYIYVYLSSLVVLTGARLSSAMTTLLVHLTSHFLRIHETKETDDGKAKKREW
jgi:hypothetical protein